MSKKLDCFINKKKNCLFAKGFCFLEQLPRKVCRSISFVEERKRNMIAIEIQIRTKRRRLEREEEHVQNIIDTNRILFE